MNSARSLVLSIAVCVGVAVPAFAQSSTIQGTLVDPQGSVIINGKISAYDEGKALVVRETVSSQDGTFQLRPLLQGTYTIRAESPGFKTAERKGVVVDPNQILSLGNVALELGQTSDTVTVLAETPLVETDTAQRGFVLTSRQVTEIPLNGRDFQSLMRTLPGVVSNDTSDFRLAFNNTNAFNVNGQRGSSNNVFLDGAINTDLGANDGQYTQVSLDAVGEFKLQTSAFNAEYGRNPGIMISINTKSGGSTLPRHGLRVPAQQRVRCAHAVRHHRQNCETSLQPVRRQPRRADPISAFIPGQAQEAVLLLQLRRHPGHPSAEQQHLRRHCQLRRSLTGNFQQTLPHQRGWLAAVIAGGTAPTSAPSSSPAPSSAILPAAPSADSRTRTTSCRSRSGTRTRRRSSS